tara:strand:+ start:5471 stop:6796 length:1326 start_codon:yes stop_codon:yes gene_type:complete
MIESDISIKDKILTLAEKSVSLKEYQFKDKDSFFANSSSFVNELKNKNEIFYPLSQSSWDYTEYNAIIDQLYTGNLTMGEKVENFEKSFAEYFGVKYAIMVNSGSSANLLIVAALSLLQKYDFKKDDEVIVPSLGWSTSYTPFAQYGLKLKFVDIDYQTLNIDPEKIKNAISKKTKAILAINILGNPIEFKKIKEICDTNKLLLIEDNCESLGAKYGERNTGNLGIAASHSFFFSHHIQTIEGGMITTNDSNICECARSLRAHGWSRDSLEKNSFSKSPSAQFKNHFNFILPGYNLRPNELNGVLGISQLQKFPKILEGRKENARIFKKLFDNQTYCSIQKCDHDSSWHGFSILLEGALQNKRDYIMNELYNNGIETRPILTGNFLKNSVCNFINYEISGILKNVEYLDRTGFYVGNSHYNLENQLSKLAEILCKLNKKNN